MQKLITKSRNFKMRKLCTWTVLGIMLSSTTIFAQGGKETYNAVHDRSLTEDFQNTFGIH